MQLLDEVNQHWSHSIDSQTSQPKHSSWPRFLSSNNSPFSSTRSVCRNLKSFNHLLVEHQQSTTMPASIPTMGMHSIYPPLDTCTGCPKCQRSKKSKPTPKTKKQHHWWFRARSSKVVRSTDNLNTPSQWQQTPVSSSGAGSAPLTPRNSLSLTESDRSTTSMDCVRAPSPEMLAFAGRTRGWAGLNEALGYKAVSKEERKSKQLRKQLRAKREEGDAVGSMLGGVFVFLW